MVLLLQRKKIGNQVTIRFNNFGICKTFYVDNPEAELRKITWYGAAYKDHFHTENNVLRALHVIKHNVDRYEDIPNYFFQWRYCRNRRGIRKCLY